MSAAEATNRSMHAMADPHARPTADHQHVLQLAGTNMADVAAGRRFVRTHVVGRVPERTSEVMQLAASELVSNALLHGPSGPVSVAVSIDDHEARLTITSGRNGSTVPPIDEWSMAGPCSKSGRGLGIVRAISTRVEVHQAPHQLAITTYFDV